MGESPADDIATTEGIVGEKPTDLSQSATVTATTAIGRWVGSDSIITTSPDIWPLYQNDAYNLNLLKFNCDGVYKLVSHVVTKINQQKIALLCY